MISKITRFGALKALAIVAVVAGAPAAAAVFTSRDYWQDQAAPPMSVEALSLFLETTALQTGTRLTAAGTPDLQQKQAYLDALEGAIAGSGADPDVAIEALVAAQTSMTAKGTMTPACNEAIIEILTRIRAFRNTPPSSIGGDSGNPAFSSPPSDSAAGGGGSDYRPA